MKVAWAKFDFIQTLRAAALPLEALQCQKFESQYCRENAGYRSVSTGAYAGDGSALAGGPGLPSFCRVQTDVPKGTARPLPLAAGESPPLHLLPRQ